MRTAEHLSLRAEVARKALHAATAVLPVALAFSWTSQETLRIVLTVAALLALAVEALRHLWPSFENRFASMFGGLMRERELRTDGARMLTGATWLALAMAIVLWFAPLRAAVAALWAAALGDAAAAVVGRSAGRWEKVGAGRKTLAGSFAALLVTAVGVFWLTAASLALALGLGVVAAAAERPAVPLDDNLRIALAVALAASVLGLR